jgi:hypothetical protein
MDNIIQKTIILARWVKDISWSDQYANERVVIQKGEDTPNIGREPHAYIWYIINNYDKLKGVYFFLQDDPRDHCPNIHDEITNTKGDFRWFGNRDNLTCNMNGAPHDRVNITKFLEECGIEYDKPNITFNGCCLFMITADKIKEHEVEYYEKILKAIESVPRGEYAFERCLGLIFNGQ